MAERCWFVAFNEKVADPGEAIGHWDPEQGPQVVTGRDGKHEDTHGKDCSAGVEKTVIRIRMLFEVEGKEFVVVGETLFVQ